MEDLPKSGYVVVGHGQACVVSEDFEQVVPLRGAPDLQALLGPDARRRKLRPNQAERVLSQLPFSPRMVPDGVQVYSYSSDAAGQAVTAATRAAALKYMSGPAKYGSGAYTWPDTGNGNS